MAEKEIESLNPEPVDVDSLTLEELEEVSGGYCGVFGGPCDTFSGGCGTFGKQPQDPIETAT